MKTEEIALQFQLQTKYDTRKELQLKLDAVKDEIATLESTLYKIRTEEWNKRHGTKITLQSEIVVTTDIRLAYVSVTHKVNYEDKYLVGSKAIIKQIDAENDRVLLSQDGCIRWFSGFLIRDSVDRVQS